MNPPILYNIRIVDMIKASNFYRDHKELVDKMASTESKFIYPTDIEVIEAPDRWQARHWKWFLKVKGHIYFGGTILNLKEARVLFD